MGHGAGAYGTQGIWSIWSGEYGVLEHMEHIRRLEQFSIGEHRGARSTASGKETFSTLVNKNSSTAAEETAAAFATALG